MTLFSTRPGSWIEKPRMDGWAAAGPRVGDLPVAAAAGLDDEGGDFLYLTGGDGIRETRSLRADPPPLSLISSRSTPVRGGASPGDNLAQLIGRCRIDFGIRIEIDHQPHGQPRPEVTRTPRIARPAGSITATSIEGAPAGEFVYVTMAVTGDEPPDIQQFGAERCPRWP